MKAVSIFTIFLSLFFAQTVFAYDFTLNLKVGDQGRDVLELQRALNKDPRTQVAILGFGSPNQETSYFGVATLKAVIKFQELYLDEILKPIGLSRGTGFVGALTRKKLASFFIAREPKTSPVQAQVMETPNLKATNTAPINYSQENNVSLSNPNLVNLDKFILEIQRVSKEYGYSEDELKIIADIIRKNAATTTDLRKEFIKMLEKEAQKEKVSSFSRPPILEKIFREILSFFGGPPYVAEAVVLPLPLPFGGALLGAFFCPVSKNYVIFIQPLPPTYVRILSYYPGTQLFASYNIPFTRNLLGFYVLGGWCQLVPKFGFPTPGTITPFVGSSLNPVDVGESAF